MRNLKELENILSKETIEIIKPLFDLHEYIKEKYNINDNEVEKRFNDYLTSNISKIESSNNKIDEMCRLTTNYAKLEGFLNHEAAGESLRYFFKLRS